MSSHCVAVCDGALLSVRLTLQLCHIHLQILYNASDSGDYSVSDSVFMCQNHLHDDLSGAVELQCGKFISESDVFNCMNHLIVWQILTVAEFLG